MASTTKLAEAVRAACLKAAIEAYESAGISGLCEEGRWECAVQAIKALDLEELVAETQRSKAPRS